MPALSRSVSVVVSLAMITAPLVAYKERQNFYDWWRLRQYTPTAEVAQLATNTTMDPLAKKIFYVSHPQLQQRDQFRSSCTTIEKTIVLGCYRSGLGIFVYDVQDSRLAGVLEVTSAHEMLHAAYERLSSKERQHVDQMTAAAYASLTDERVKKNVEAYRSRDAGVVPNELHSILGTEVRNLPADLEAYYKKYFADRKKIVSYSEQYEAEFTNRENAVTAYDAQLKSLKAEIESLNASLATEGADIEKNDARLESLLAAKDYVNYNAGIPSYQAKINAYNAQVRTLKSDITTYNDIVDKRNSIVTEEQQLINAIDSSVPAAK